MLALVSQAGWCLCSMNTNDRKQWRSSQVLVAFAAATTDPKVVQVSIKGPYIFLPYSFDAVQASSPLTSSHSTHNNVEGWSDEPGFGTGLNV